MAANVSAVVHEEKYRGKNFDLLSKCNILVAGAGALGSNLVDNLARQGFKLFTVIDFDRVELSNIGTQRYGRNNIGALKVDALKNIIYIAAGVEIKTVKERLTPDNAEKYLRGYHLIVDCFDNGPARQICQDFARKFGVPTLHVGLLEDYAQVIWDHIYGVPNVAEGSDVCDYPLARNIVMLAVTVASENIVEFVLKGKRLSHSITLQDRKITAH